MIKNQSLLILIIICTSQFVSAQIAFTNATDKLGNKFVNSGAAIGVADMNGDGLDDIIRLHSTTQLVIDEQTSSGNFISNVTGVNSPLAVWSLCIGDVDRNGGNDVFLATANDLHRMAWSDDGANTYTEQTLNGPPILPQASNFADINNDGHLDLFVCNDNGINLPYLGDGKALHLDPNLINTETTPKSDNSGNYGSIWVDYDNDQDQDLYISKCRLGITDPNDPRRINQLFENDGNGNFSEVALSKGLVPFAQSWATDFGDIDNDGDLDVFIINHDKPSQLFENDGNGNFTDITTQAGFSPALANHGLGIQVKMADFDNDGFLDILLTSSQGGFKCLRNNGNKTFSAIFSAFQTLDPMQSFALGDLNNDGFLDVMGGFGQYFNTPTEIFDKLFLNNTTGNNWLRVNLKGTNSNINGIGARIELHGSWGIMVREIRSGESYGITNSLSANFGLGGATSIDHMVIKWPSGYIETINNPVINQVHQIEEGGCLNPETGFINQTICEGEILEIEGTQLTESGSYEFITALSDDCDSTTVLDLLVLPSTQTFNAISVCSGEIIPIPGGGSQVITQDEIFEAYFTGQNGCDSISVLEINVLDVYSTSESITVCQGENYTWPDGTSSVVLDAQSYTSRLFSQFNCDSIVVTSVTVIAAPNSQEYIQVCKGENYTFPDGNTLTVDAEIIYDITYPSSGSCDSIANFIVELYPDYNIVDSDRACLGGNYTFPDGTEFGGLTQDFSYTSYLQSENGCDSIVLINLSLEQASNVSETVAVCQGETFTFPDGSAEVITQGFTHISSMTNQFGCDSIINTSISTKQSYQFTLSQMICYGDNYTFFDGTTELEVTENLTHNTYFTTFDGCDSIITTELLVIPPMYTYDTGLVCQGESYVFPDGNIISNIQDEITYESTLVPTSGCDIILSTTVSVSPAYNNVEIYTVCPGEGITIDDLVIDLIEKDTSIYFPGTTVFGCDSITNIEIIVDNINTEINLTEATVTASAVDVSYQWLDCDNNLEPIPGATTQVFSPDFDGNYQVVLEGPTGCIAYSECINIVGVATEDPILSGLVSVFPNPAKDEIQLLMEGEASISAATIIDIQGRKLLDLDISHETNIFNISELSSGLYFIKVETDDRFTVKRFIKL